MFFQIQHLQAEFVHIFYVHAVTGSVYREAGRNISACENPRLTILFARESTWAEGDGQKPEPVPVSINCTDFQRRKTSVVQLKHPSVTELASNSIRTKYARGLSMVLQD